MAGHARCWRSGKPSLRVTGYATGGRVRSQQRELRARMIERCRSPVARSMTHRAVPWERCGLVVGIDRAVIQRAVTRCAIRGRPHETIAGVTIRTGRQQMRSRQRKMCEGPMIELRREFRVQPLIHGMATLASRAEAYGAMVNRSRCSVIRGMAGNARRAQPRKSTAGGSTMTGFAGGSCVRARQRKSIQMLPDRIELNAPALNRVAALAGCPKLTTMDIGMA